MLTRSIEGDRVTPLPLSRSLRGSGELSRTPTPRGAEVAISQFPSSRNRWMTGGRSEDHDANSVQPQD